MSEGDLVDKPCQRQCSRRGARKLDFIFYHEADLRAAIAANPTATMVEIDGVEIAEPSRWLAVIDKTYAFFEKDRPAYAEAARQRYQGRYYKDATRACGLRHSQYYIAVATFRAYAAIFSVASSPPLLTADERDTAI